MGTLAAAVARSAPGKIAAFGRIAQAAVLLSAVLIGIEFIAAVLAATAHASTDIGLTKAIAHLAGLHEENAELAISLPQMWVVGAIIAMPRAVMIFGLYQLWRYFQACLGGRAFEKDPLRRVWRFSLACLLTSLLYIVIQPLAMQVISIGTTTPHPFGPITIRSEHLHAVFLSVCVLGLAAVLSEAARLADEIREFI